MLCTRHVPLYPALLGRVRGGILYIVKVFLRFPYVLQVGGPSPLDPHLLIKSRPEHGRGALGTAVHDEYRAL